MKRDKDLMISAVIVAAGKGTRMNMDINKQYIEIGDMPVLARTLEVFESCRLIEEIIVVVNGHDIVYCKENIIDAFGFTKVAKLVAGASTRQGSVYKGLCEVREVCDIVLIHDGARPFVTEQCLKDSIYAAQEYGACCLAVPVKDTVKEVDEQGFVRKTLNRNSLWAIQTPQTFKYRLILDAHIKAAQEGFIGTDDATLVERMGHPLKLIMGDYNNIKITTQEDLILAEAILSSREE